MDRVYKLLQGLKPEFEGIHSQLHIRENTLSFHDVVSRLLSEESRPQEMKGGSGGSTHSVASEGGSSSKSSHQVAPPNSNPK